MCSLRISQKVSGFFFFFVCIITAGKSAPALSHRHLGRVTSLHRSAALLIFDPGSPGTLVANLIGAPRQPVVVVDAWTELRTTAESDF